MVESETVKNYLVVVGDDIDEMMMNNRLFVMVEDTVSKRGFTRVKVKAVDIPIRRAPGVALWNTLLGRPTVVNGVNLDEVREVGGLKTNLIFDVKVNGSPNIKIVFPEEFDKLPASIKQNEYLSLGLRLAYNAMRAKEQIDEMTKTADASQREVLDKMSEGYLQTFDTVAKAMERLKKISEGETPSTSRKDEGNDKKNGGGEAK